MAWYDEYIDRIEGIAGGYPKLKGRRISIRNVVERLRVVGTFEELCRSYPHLTPEQLKAALAYYEDHRELIEEDIERNRKAWEEVVAGKWRRD